MRMVTASVVLFRTPKNQIDALLGSVLPSCAEKVFVIDNSPDDRWRETESRSPKVRYIHNANLGYGGSHNLAVRLAIECGADYHVVLNPDIRFEPSVLETLEKFMDENADAVYVLPEVVGPDGSLQYLCKLLPSPADLIFRRFVPAAGILKSWKEKKDARYCLKDSGYSRVMNAPCLSGCFMFMRTSALRAVGPDGEFFDGRFFMYFEDFDLIRRLHRVGRTLYQPAVRIVHDHARESYRSGRMLRAHIVSAIRYFGKWGWLFDRERREWNRETVREIENASRGQFASVDMKPVRIADANADILREAGQKEN